MAEDLEKVVKEVAARYGKDRTRMMDIVRDVQARFGHISGAAMDIIAREVNSHRVEVEGVVTFYAFYSEKPNGRHVIRITDCVTARMRHAEEVVEAFEKELGIKVGGTTPDGQITLEMTSCIGLCDQGPAALIDDVPVTYITPDKVKGLLRHLRESGDATTLVKTLGEGNNALDLVHSMVINNIRKRGDVIFASLEAGASIKNAIAISPNEVIRSVKTARLRGRGGAGFPAGMKWEFARNAAGKRKILVCNADEGEPGTFKDRVILTEVPGLLFEGMTVAGYAIGAAEGLLYLRGEYAYLKPYLDHLLEQRRAKKLLGKSVAGKSGFDFDIRVQLGAGAYVCGEESALIRSCEGLRGSPRDRPPFPVEKGYLDLPTVVNNVETLCCAARVLEKGAGWFAQIGSEQSSGTKLFSVSGDCRRPGVYELPFGMTLTEFLREVGGDDAQAVQVGGPSGTCVDRGQFGRKLGFEDLPTGGSMIVIGPQRDILAVASAFMEFFVEESCGWCAPCRIGNVLIQERLERIRAGKGLPEDLMYLEDLCTTVKKTSRCGLGQTSPNPVATTLQNFRKAYEAKLLSAREDGRQPTFDLRAALSEAVRVQGREPVAH
ncbi:MAG: NAD(P)H-dependent oxidoreductase subunit E [Deltaproteobacteria bacterium]|nr:NAD(P)H-dependent oxidoreductase subunit E [Deltaproteobacteria bacterium]